MNINYKYKIKFNRIKLDQLSSEKSIIWTWSGFFTWSFSVLDPPLNGSGHLVEFCSFCAQISIFLCFYFNFDNNLFKFGNLRENFDITLGLKVKDSKNEEKLCKGSFKYSETNFSLFFNPFENGFQRISSGIPRYSKWFLTFKWLWEYAETPQKLCGELTKKFPLMNARQFNCCIVSFNNVKNVFYKKI